MTALFVVLLLGALYHDTQAQMGEYYVRNKGFHPHTYIGVDPNAVVEYKTALTPAPDYFITGDYIVHRRICQIGMVIGAEKKAIGSGAMLNSGKKLTFENLCEMDGFSLDPFRERFTGTIDENCCLDPGNYTLSNWSIEQHMKPSITMMYYGDYTFHLCWTENGKMDECILENDIKMLFDNINKKEAEAKTEGKKGGKGKKQKKNKGN